MKRLIYLEKIVDYLLNMEAPPLWPEKIADPPGDSFAYYYRPPLAEGQRGVWDLQANAAPT